MKGVQLTKMVQELELNNLTPEIDLSGIVIKTAEINRPALQLTGYLEHFANERVHLSDMQPSCMMTREHRSDSFQPLHPTVFRSPWTRSRSVCSMQW